MQEGLNPRASLVIRRHMTTHLKLSHFGIGDRVACILGMYLYMYIYVCMYIYLYKIFIYVFYVYMYLYCGIGYIYIYIYTYVYICIYISYTYPIFVASSLSDLPEIESIDISSNVLTDVSLEPLMMAITSISNLSELNLR
jgi:hypothetical protein